MSFKLLFGLGLQVVALLLILTRVRQRRLAYTGVVFIWMSLIYHGLTELAQIAYPGMNYYRTMVSQAKIDNWMMVISPAILIFAATYCLHVRPLSRQELEVSPGSALGLVDWRWSIFIVVLLNLLVAGVLGRFNLGYWGGLITETLPAISALMFLEFIQKMRGRYLSLVLLFQVGLGILSGTRSAIVFTLVVLLCVFVRSGVPIRWRSLFWPGLAGVFLMLAISGMRAEVGRFIYAEQTNRQRIGSLLAGIGSVLRNGLAPEILQDYVYRFDGNAFSGLVVAGYDAGIKPAGWTPILNNFLLAVPSFLNPTKLEAGRWMLNDED